MYLTLTNWHSLCKLALMLFKLTTILFACILSLSAVAQSDTTMPAPLPVKLYVAMRDTANALDIIFNIGKGSSVSFDGHNVQMFTAFIDNAPARRDILNPAGVIMWQIDGKELLSGKFYLGDTTGYVVFFKDGREYVNLINKNGNTFL